MNYRKKVVSFEAKLQEKTAEQEARFAKMDKTADAYALLGAAIGKMRELGLPPKSIIRVLRVAADELSESYYD